MPDAVALLLSVALPWSVGTLAVAALYRGDAAPGRLRALGHGYLVGAFAATLVLRALSLAGVHWSLAAAALPMLALAAVLLRPARGFASPRALRERARAARDSLRGQPPWLRAVFGCCLALVAVRLAGLGLEIVWRPLLPWDAWSQWATKARVWYEYGRLVPFVPQAAWLAPGDALRFVDMHPGYPATVPLLQVWTNLWLGRWDESLMNLPWLALACALGLAFYAELRDAGSSAPRAMLFTYLLLSLPFLDLHVALAGTADIFVAASYGLAAILLWRWVRTRAPRDLALAALLALLCATVKVEGVLWAATLVPALVTALRRRAGFALVAALGVGALAYLAFGPDELALFGYKLHNRITDISLPLAQHLFVMDNWHLLWYATLAVLVLRRRRLLAPDLAPMTVGIAGAFALVAVVYFFSSAAGGVEDESLVNRMPLQMVPALVFYVALLLRPPPSERAAPASRSTALQANAADA